MTNTICGAECWTNHRLDVSKLNLRIQPVRRPQGNKAHKRLDVSKLNQDSTRQSDICNQLDAINLSAENPKETGQFAIKQVILQLLLLYDIYLANIKRSNKKLKLRSFKNSEHINEKGDGPYRDY